jgi:hypothetical protein
MRELLADGKTAIELEQLHQVDDRTFPIEVFVLVSAIRSIFASKSAREIGAAVAVGEAVAPIGFAAAGVGAAWACPKIAEAILAKILIVLSLACPLGPARKTLVGRHPAVGRKMIDGAR